MGFLLIIILICLLYTSDAADELDGVNTYNQNDNEQESHIESTAGKSVFGHSGKCLDTFPDTVCHVIDEVQLIRLL